MTYDARQIANWFVLRAAREGRPLSIMSLLKLVYISHGWHLEMYKTPLFSNSIEAWQYGPVVPDVYNAFRKQGIVVSTPFPGHSGKLAPEDESLLEQVYTIYGRLPALRLSDLTHEEGGPWAIARQLGGWYAPIPNDLIQSHYELKRAKSQNSP